MKKFRMFHYSLQFSVVLLFESLAASWVHCYTFFTHAIQEIQTHLGLCYRVTVLGC